MTDQPKTDIGALTISNSSIPGSTPTPHTTHVLRGLEMRTCPLCGQYGPTAHVHALVDMRAIIATSAGRWPR